MNSLIKKLTALLLLFVYSNLYAASEDITYKGLELGASIERYKTALPDHECLSDYSCDFYLEECFKKTIGTNRVKDCMDRNSFGGLAPNQVTTYFHEKKLARYIMSFSSNSFMFLIEALTSKLGEPTSLEDFPVQTGAGALYTNKKAVWTSPIATVEIQQYCGTIKKMCVNISTVEDEQRLKAEREEGKKRRVKDF